MSDKKLISSEELNSMMAKDPLIDAIVKDRQEAIKTGRLSKWTKLRMPNGLVIEPVSKSQARRLVSQGGKPDGE